LLLIPRSPNSTIFPYTTLFRSYYNHYKVYRKAEKYYEEVNEAVSNLLSNYSLFTYPAHFLLTKLERYNRIQEEVDMCSENEGLFHDFECDKNDVPKYVTYVTYRSLCCY